MLAQQTLLVTGLLLLALWIVSWTSISTSIFVYPDHKQLFVQILLKCVASIRSIRLLILKSFDIFMIPRQAASDGSPLTADDKEKFLVKPFDAVLCSSLIRKCFFTSDLILHHPRPSSIVAKDSKKQRKENASLYRVTSCHSKILQDVAINMFLARISRAAC